MVMHARSGGNLEVMGMLLGKADVQQLLVMDSFALPVQGTETRVNAGAQALEYMTEYVEMAKEVRREEHVVGWYHSHPGYGCWLSGIDVSTQMMHQKFQDPFVAIVVRPSLVPCPTPTPTPTPTLAPLPPSSFSSSSSSPSPVAHLPAT